MESLYSFIDFVFGSFMSIFYLSLPLILIFYLKHKVLRKLSIIENLLKNKQDNE